MDVAIVGAGLSGSLLALALKDSHPLLKVGVFEKSEAPCGNHTWCFHDQDIPESLSKWLEPLISKTWHGYEVHFPKYSRILNGKYHAIKSQDLRTKVQEQISGSLFLNHELSEVIKKDGYSELKFKNGNVIQAKSVILAQGWRNVLKSTQIGWQKFVGLDVLLEKPHGLARPILKDVLQEQKDGYRFIYSLPFNETQLLIEDTYYSNSPELEIEDIKADIFKYAQSKGWQIKHLERTEFGSLPLFLDLPENEDSPWPRLGAGSQFVNPVTGYTLPMTLQSIHALVSQNDFSQDNLKTLLKKVEDRYRKNLGYLSRLNRMMFLAATPESRYQILERFYRLSEGLIGRFYSGQLLFRDRVRILVGRPPVPVVRAIKALTKNLT